MRQYRIFIFESGAHMTSQPPIEIECKDDGEAVNAAKQLVDGKDIELWEESRFIARFSRTK